MAKIYTKKGDQGETRLVSGETVSKGNMRLESYGTLDELNSTIGVVLSHIDESKYKDQLRSKLGESLFQIQNALFNLGSQLACADEKLGNQLPNISEGDIQKLEAKIDELEAELSPLKNFILPGGSKAAAALHISRTVCRRAERLCIRVRDENITIQPLTIQYLNRLSDLFFVMSRFCNKTEGFSETEWKSK